MFRTTSRPVSLSLCPKCLVLSAPGHYLQLLKGDQKQRHKPILFGKSIGSPWLATQKWVPPGRFLVFEKLTRDLWFQGTHHLWELDSSQDHLGKWFDSWLLRSPICPRLLWIDVMTGILLVFVLRLSFGFIQALRFQGLGSPPLLTFLCTHSIPINTGLPSGQGLLVSYGNDSQMLCRSVLTSFWKY